MEVSGDSKEEEVASEDFVSFSHVINAVEHAAEHAVDAFEDFVLSQVNDPKSYRHHASILFNRQHLVRVLEA